MAKHLDQDEAEMCVTHISEETETGEATISIADPHALLKMAPKQPVACACEAQAAMTTPQTGFDEHKNVMICVAYASAYHMVRTEGAWKQFLADPGWGGLTKKPKNNLRGMSRILHHVMRFIFRAEAHKARNRVRIYANMLIERFNKGVHPDEIVVLLTENGIEKLRREGEAARRQQRSNDAFLESLRELNEDDESDGKLNRHDKKLEIDQISKMSKALAEFNAACLTFMAKNMRDGE